VFNYRLDIWPFFKFSAHAMTISSRLLKQSTQSLRARPLALRIQLIAVVMVMLSANHGWAGEPNTDYNAVFTLQLSADQAKAIGTLSIDQPSQIMERMALRMPTDRYRLISADGDSHREGDIVHWIPPVGQGVIRYEVMINQPRGKAFDGLIKQDWAIFRGDNIFPTARVNFVDGARSRSRVVLFITDGGEHIKPQKAANHDRLVVVNPRV
jgi:hypothetical protein